jgi:hypothetical protein
VGLEVPNRLYNPSQAPTLNDGATRGVLKVYGRLGISAVAPEIDPNCLSISPYNILSYGKGNARANKIGVKETVSLGYPIKIFIL